MPQRASVFCNFYIRVDREALVSERALDVGSVAFKAKSTKNCLKFSRNFATRHWRPEVNINVTTVSKHFYEIKILPIIRTYA
jgi:hypothetical protein